MTKFVGSSRVREGGRPVTHYQDFIAHTGGTDWRHEASQIDMNPSVLGGTTAQSAIQGLFNYISGTGTGFTSIGSIDGYAGFYATGIYNVNSVETPTLKDAINAAVNDARLANGGVILLLPGHYRVSDTITIPNGISLIGEGPGVYIIGETSGGNSIFNVTSVSTDFSINGDSGLGDQNLILGTGVKKTTFKNLIITDNSDGYVNSGNSTLSSSGMILVDRGSNVDFEKVTFIGRLNDGPILNRLKTTTAIFTLPIGLAKGTSINVNNCYFDGLRSPISFNSQLGSSDYLFVKNSKIKFYGEEAASYSSNDCAIVSSLANIEIKNNFFLGAGTYSETILGILSDSVSNPTDCSVAIVGNSGYSIGNISRLCDTAYTLPIRSTMHSNTFGVGKDGNKPWTIVLGMDEGDILGEGGLDLLLSTYSLLSEIPTKVILNPGNYSLTVASGTFTSLKLEGNPIGKRYPSISLQLTGSSVDNLTNKYVAFGNLENIYFTSVGEFQSVHASSIFTSSSNSRAESIIVNNCIFKDTSLYVDTDGSDSSTNPTAAWDGTSSRMQAFISKCRFYQSGDFNENWSLFLPQINIIKISDSYFHGSGYALLFGNVFGSGTVNTNLNIDNCTFDISGATITSPPPVSQPFYININSSDPTICKITNSIFLSSSDGNSAPSIFSNAVSRIFIRISAGSTYIDNCYFNTPGAKYLDSSVEYPMAGIHVGWIDSIIISNNIFNSGGLPIQIRRSNLTSSDQHYCNISNNRINQLSNFLTLLDVDCTTDADDSIIRTIFMDSNLFVNTKNISSSNFPYHDNLIGSGYNVHGAIQIYALASNINFTNNDVYVSDMRTPASSSFTHVTGVYLNSSASSYGKTSSVNTSNNHIDITGTNITPASSSEFCSSLQVKSNNIRVQGNKINFVGNGTATSGFKGCLVIDGLLDGSSGTGIVTNNIFDRVDGSGTLTNLYRGYALITSATNYSGQFIDNNFVSPYISGTTTTLLEDNTSTANEWLFDRNKNQTVKLTIPPSYGQLTITSDSTAAGYVNTSTLLSGNSSIRINENPFSTNGMTLQAYHNNTTGSNFYYWISHLNPLIPLGAKFLSAEINVRIDSTSNIDSVLATLDIRKLGAGYNTYNDSVSSLSTSDTLLSVSQEILSDQTYIIESIVTLALNTTTVDTHTISATPLVVYYRY